MKREELGGGSSAVCCEAVSFGGVTLSFATRSLLRGQVVNGVGSRSRTMRGGSWQRSRSARWVKLAAEDILRDVAGAVCGLWAEAARLLCFIMRSAT